MEQKYPIKRTPTFCSNYNGRQKLGTKLIIHSFMIPVFYYLLFCNTGVTTATRTGRTIQTTPCEDYVTVVVIIITAAAAAAVYRRRLDCNDEGNTIVRGKKYNNVVLRCRRVYMTIHLSVEYHNIGRPRSNVVDMPDRRRHLPYSRNYTPPLFIVYLQRESHKQGGCSAIHSSLPLTK